MQHQPPHITWCVYASRSTAMWEVCRVIRSFFVDKRDRPQCCSRWVNSSVLATLSLVMSLLQRGKFADERPHRGANIMDLADMRATRLCGRPWPAARRTCLLDGVHRPPPPPPRFSPLKAALKYCRQRIRKFIAINNGRRRAERPRWWGKRPRSAA